MVYQESCVSMCRNRCKEGNPVPVRPHHGMCLAYFKGYGYSSAFSIHMQEMLELFEKDVPVRLTVSTDEICSACPNNRDGACKDAAHVYEYDKAVLDMCGLSDGTEISFLSFAKTVQNKILRDGSRKNICGTCQWNEICSSQKSRWESLT